MPNYWPSPVTIGASTICSSIAAPNTRTLSRKNCSRSSANEKQHYPSGGRTERKVVDVLGHPPSLAFPSLEGTANEPRNGNHQIVFHFAESRPAKVQTRSRTRCLILRLCSQNVLAQLLA